MKKAVLKILLTFAILSAICCAFLAAQMADVRQRSCDIVRHNRWGHRHRSCLTFLRENTELNIKIPADGGNFFTVLPLSGRVPAFPGRSAGSAPPASRWRSGAPADPAVGAVPAAAVCCPLLRPAPHSIRSALVMGVFSAAGSVVSSKKRGARPAESL